ncbi:MAG: T9SS type A sorting domain-containing protein [Flavobacteriales bacterium]|nr:T9SS type A sorting domain-containing protein [Flavobacteriales bacterium]
MKSVSSQISLTVAIAAIFLIGTTSTAQVLFDVTASGTTFTPSNINIDIGDTVRWTNASGFHNVNATTDTFPSNPEGFGNAIAGDPWTFTQMFSLAGTYNYQCDAHILANMVGTVTVADPAGISDNSSANPDAIVNMYPVPASNFVVMELNENLLSTNSTLSVTVFDLAGKEVYREDNITGSSIRFETSGWSKSVYTFKLQSDAEVIQTEKILVK